MLQRIFSTEGGSEALDVLMKYLFVPHTYLVGAEDISLFLDEPDSNSSYTIDTKEWLLRAQAKVLIEARRLHPKAPASHKWAVDQELKMKVVVQQ